MKKLLLISLFAILLIILLAVGVGIYFKKSAESCTNENCNQIINKNYQKNNETLTIIENDFRLKDECGDGVCRNDENELICPQCEPMPGKTSCPTVCHVRCPKDCDTNNYYLCESDKDCTTGISCIEKTFVSRTYRVCDYKK